MTALHALAAIALLAALHQGWRAWRRRDRAWRVFVLVLGQGVLALALALVLWPPPRFAAPPRLVLLTADADAPALRDGDRLFALPEAPAVAGAERVPDLGTLLRRFPRAAALHVVGAGLTPRDHDAARGLRIDFSPSPLPEGVVALQAPAAPVQGRRFRVHGRVQDGAGQWMDLRDPAGRRVDRQPIGDDGAFSLQAQAGAAGRVAYRLQRRGADDAVREEIVLPMAVVAPAPLRLRVVDGGIGPETKFLRRWAEDAGLSVQSELALGGGVRIGDAATPLTAAGVAEVDVLVLDDRRWRALGDRGRADLLAAVQDGLGLLLRWTSDATAADIASLRAWGFTVAAADLPRGMRLAGSEHADDVLAPSNGASTDASVPEPSGDGDDALLDKATDTAPLLSRRPLSLAADDGVPLLRADDGAVLALWRAEGRGRVAVWTLGDSFRLVLAGRRALHGDTWASALSTLARAGGARAATPPATARLQQRAVFCDLHDNAHVTSPDGDTTPLARDPASGCAAFWPTQPGWHTLHDGDDAQAFTVLDTGERAGLERAQWLEDTQRLAAAAIGPLHSAPSAPLPGPGPRWPWLAVFLAVAAALWWLERSRAGRRDPA